MNGGYTRRNLLTGAVLYPLGDTLGVFCVGDLIWTRILGMALVGSLVYGWEIPHYFRWLDKRMSHRT